MQLKRPPTGRLVLALGLVLIAAGYAHAQSSLGIGSAEPSAAPGGWPLLTWINAQQQTFYRALTGALKAMRGDPWKLSLLVGLSFSYGVFHAAGPGHGKAVISSYMIANEVALRRGVVLSFLSSFMQALTAIVVVGLAYLVLRGTTVSMTDATYALELASYALIAAFGGWLLWRKLASLLWTGRQTAAGQNAHAPAHAGHHHDHHHHGHHGHDHDAGEICPSCGHSHAPDPTRLSGKDFSLRDAWSAVIAVGLRPCSGALLVLTFSLLNGLYLGGILSVLAMALGTAITVSALATLAVTVKGLAVRLAGDKRADNVGAAFEITGASVVLILGLTLLAAALQN